MAKPTNEANRPLAVLNLPRGIHAFITYATEVVKAMTANPAFPVTPVAPHVRAGSGGRQRAGRVGHHPEREHAPVTFTVSPTRARGSKLAG